MTYQLARPRTIRSDHGDVAVKKCIGLGRKERMFPPGVGAEGGQGAETFVAEVADVLEDDTPSELQEEAELLVIESQPKQGRNVK